MWAVLAGVLLLWVGLGHAQPGNTLSLAVEQSIADILKAKAQRTPAQRKLSSQLLDDAARQPAQPADTQAGPAQRTPVQRRLSSQLLDDAARQPAQPAEVPATRVTVDIRADVTDAVLDRVRALGGTVVNSVPAYRAIRARLPLSALETLAELDAVQSIRPPDIAITNRVVTHSGSLTTEGDAAHQADAARQTYSIDGTGIGIGVLSDGVKTLAARQATGDLPAQVTVLPGQEGGPIGWIFESSGDEGTAMLEIIHDLAPGAELFFATGTGGGRAEMAQNIEDLCAAGANIIVDDITYLLAPAFQDGPIAQAISKVVARGCYYFSAAGNSGNLNDGTSGVWEGDFAAGPALSLSGVSAGAVFHDFGGGVAGNQIEKATSFITLKWADPVGASTNDYDLFLIDAQGNVLSSSTDTQDGSQDPVEDIWTFFPDYKGARLVIVKNAGAADRYLHLNCSRGELAIATSGQTFGHSASQDAIGVAAVDARTAGGAGGGFDGAEAVETFSSDGPRRMFFEADGTPITPGNFSATGGKVLQKPDVAAADAVATTTPGFSRFRGTSAAAPHAAAVAALVLEAGGGPAHVTPEELRAALTGSALDIEASGVDRDSGAGIVMAPAAVDTVDVAVADRNKAPTVESAPTDRTLKPGGDVATLDLTGVFSDPEAGTLTYTALSSHPGFVTDSLSGTTLTLTPVAARRTAVTVRATDPGGLSAIVAFDVVVIAGTHDYDTDDDGLIEVTSLEQFNAIRYDLDGDGTVEVGADWTAYNTAFPAAALDMGCPAGCIGYELTANLDFDTNNSGRADAGDMYWNGGAGWAPIGALGSPFTATLEGNGHTLANLFIDRPRRSWDCGLFGTVEFAGTDNAIRHVGLVNVQISGWVNAGGLAGKTSGGTISNSFVTGSVASRINTGGLVGTAYGTTITASYATGEVSGTTAFSDAGGLVGYCSGSITASYATGRVTGEENAGGLVGRYSGWYRRTIAASYATGRVTGEENVGGLVGHHSGGTIAASYATGRVTGEENVGGLVGHHSGGTITASYWDMLTSGQTTGAHGVGQTTVALQEPTDYTGIYQSWDVDLDGDRVADDPWHFGTALQQPVLAADMNKDQRATWQEFGYQFRAGPSLTLTTDRSVGVTLTWSAVDVSHWRSAPAVTYAIYRADRADPLATALAGTQYTDTSASTGTVYRYQVVAVVNGEEAPRSGWAAVTAGVANQPPAFSPDAARPRSVPENTPSGQNIGPPVTATDPESDTLRYTLSGPDAASFNLVPSSGQLQTTQAALTPGNYTVSVSVGDGKAADGTSDQAIDDTTTVSIKVIRAVNRPPAFNHGAGRARRSVPENTPSGQNIGPPVTATDPESDPLRYTLSGLDAWSFAIVPTSGQLRTRSSLDYERKNRYEVSVSVSDGKAAATTTVDIYVTNVDETVTAPVPPPTNPPPTNQPPAFNSIGSLRHSVPENTPPGRNIGPPVTATDPEDDPLTYTLQGGRQDTRTFDIEATSGQLRTKTALDYERYDYYRFYVLVSDGKAADGTPDPTPDARVRVRIYVTDVDEPANRPPAFNHGSGQARRSVPENTPPGRNIGPPVTATDPEDDPLRYTLSGPDAASFAIVPSSGQLRTRAALDYERKNHYTVNVSVSDGKAADHTPDPTPDAVIRVSISVTDVDETVITPPPPPPGGPDGPGGGGDGGGTATPDDRHGDTPDAATALTPAGHTGALARTMTAHLQSRRDVDYFQLDLSRGGVLTASTTGVTDTTGRLYEAQEDDAPLLLVADDTDSGSGANFRLGVAVEPGTYYLAVSAGASFGDYRLLVDYTPAFVDNPAPDSPQSGLGVLSGWVCAADTVEIELVPASGETQTMVPATGTARADTAGVCGADTTDTGFGLLFNWNLLGDGAHTVRVLVNDVVFADRAITVTTLGPHPEQEYRPGLSGTSTIPDFPAAGQSTTLRWAEALQNFVIAGDERGSGGAQLTPEQARLENPAPGSFQSGLGVISGWVCEADTVEIVFEPEGTDDTLPFEAGSGTERADTADRCGDSDNGFGLLFNWNLLGEGQHTVRAYADGEEFAHSTVTVTTLGEEFAEGLRRTHTIEDFPAAGQTTTVEWREGQQNFVITAVE